MKNPELKRVFDGLLRTPWLWSFLGAALVWAITLVGVGGQGAGGIVTTALTFSVFMVLVGFGQMLVITSGPGNVDLSIPATIALSGAVSMKLMDSQDHLVLVGLGASLLVGICVGGLNYMLIRLLRIPPIIATMSSSFLIQSVAISYGRGLRVQPPALLSEFATGRALGVPYTAMALVIFSVGLGILVTRSVYGISLSAVGQNPRAAELAGVRVERTRYITYTLSAALAALTGFLLSGFSGGATLDMGEEYMLASIAVAVIGGTNVAGGRASVPGIWGAALFLFLMVTMLNALGVGSGLRLVITGLLIITIIIFATNDKA
jgi:ribose transport system permease protein